MFNLLKMFNKQDPVALTVAPSLRFISVGREIKVVVDSGEEDLNHRVSQSRLDENESSAIKRIFVTGFEEIYTSFADETASTPASESVEDEELQSETLAKTSKKPVDIREDVVNTVGAALPEGLMIEHLEGSADKELSRQSKKVKTLIEDAFEYEEGIMMGEVCLELDSGQSYVIANPVYNVLPTDVDGDIEFVEVNQARDYIEGEWSDEFAKALIAMVDGSDGGAGMPVREPRERNSKANPSFVAKIAKTFGGVAAIAAISLGAIAGYGVIKGGSAADGYQAAASAPVFAQTARAASGGSASAENPVMPSAEDYAALQTRATEDMLAKMNVDISDTADLGCLAN